MFLLEKSKKRWKESFFKKKKSLILSLKEMKNKKAYWCIVENCEKLGLTNRNGKTSHMHTHAHMLITILLKQKYGWISVWLIFGNALVG